MFELVSSRIIIIIATLSATFVTGWYFNGLRWETKVLRITESHAKLITDATNAARKKEQEMQEAADKLRKTKDDQIRTINARLDATLVELRDRPTRSSNAFAQGPGIRPPAAGGTGAFLFREDATFLAREAARADLIRASLLQCTAQYDEVTGYGRR